MWSIQCESHNVEGSHCYFQFVKRIRECYAILYDHFRIDFDCIRFTCYKWQQMLSWVLLSFDVSSNYLYIVYEYNIVTAEYLWVDQKKNIIICWYRLETMDRKPRILSTNLRYVTGRSIFLKIESNEFYGVNNDEPFLNLK